jgi:hypothetical protein
LKTTLQAAFFAFLTGLLLAVLVTPAHTYLSEYTSSIANRDRWDFTAFPVTYHINPAHGSNLVGAAPVGSVIDAAFASWLTAPNTALAVTRGADSSSTAVAADGTNLVCFTCQADFSQDATTLAVTITTTADAPGNADLHGGSARFTAQLLDADIVFNPAVCFTTDPTPSTCADGRNTNDLQTVATHEIGHFFGLDHSAIVRAVMFPFTPASQHLLSLDDVAGISTTYPKTTPDFPIGSIAGTVSFASGGPVLGAHVYAESQTSSSNFPASIRKTPIGTLTLDTGAYTIDGVPPDQYVVVAEPLDQPVTNSNITTYAPLFGVNKTVNTGFTTTFH